MYKNSQSGLGTVTVNDIGQMSFYLARCVTGIRGVSSHIGGPPSPKTPRRSFNPEIFYFKLVQNHVRNFTYNILYNIRSTMYLVSLLYVHARIVHATHSTLRSVWNN